MSRLSFIVHARQYHKSHLFLNLRCSYSFFVVPLHPMWTHSQESHRIDCSPVLTVLIPQGSFTQLLGFVTLVKMIFIIRSTVYAIFVFPWGSGGGGGVIVYVC